jgi:serralysin
VSGDTVELYQGTSVIVSAGDITTYGAFPTLDIQFQGLPTLDLTGETISQTSTIETVYTGDSGTVVLRGSSTDAGLLVSNGIGLTLTLDIETASGSQGLAVTSTGALYAINSGTVAVTGTAGATVTNAGFIQAGALVSNTATLGTITDALATDNTGSILVEPYSSVTFTASVTNEAAGVISDNQGTLTINGSLGNSGVISASGGTLTLSGAESGAGSITVANTGTLQFTGAAANTIASSGTIQVGTLTNNLASLGTFTSTQMLDNSGTFNVQAFSAATLNASATNEAGGTLTDSDGTLTFNAGLTNRGSLTQSDGVIAVLGGLVNSGSITQSSGSLTIAGGINNTGLITYAGGSLSITGGLSGTGTLSIGDGLTADVAGAVASTAKISFATGVGILSLGTPASFAGTITNLTGHDLIDLTGLANATATVNAGAVTVTQNGTTALSFTATGLTSGQLYAVSDGNGGTILTLKQSGTAGAINAIINGATGHATHQWQLTGGAGPTVTYSFDPTSNWTGAEQQAFINGLSLYSALAKISFTEATGGAAGEIVFTRGSSGGAYTTWANDNTTGNISSANVVIDTSVTSFSNITTFGTSDGTGQGGYGWDTVLHEEGHALGFSHPGDYNESADIATQQTFYDDTHQYTVMSYFGADYSGANTVVNGISINDQTPMLFDIAAIQQIYGANTTTLAGGDTFGFNASAAITGNTALNSVYNFSSNTTPVVTIWDGGVNNTLDLSGFTQSGTIDLNAGDFSSVDGMTDNLAIAYGTTIDTAVGGSGNTVFVVNSDSDRIKGGSGTNTVAFTGNRSAYSIAFNAGTVTVASGGVTDTLTNVQSLRFADQTVAACFATGTRILTERGEVAIESLIPFEDWVITASGCAAQVIWVGHRRAELARHPRPWDVMPVRIAADAFGPGLPARDLIVSPDHALSLDGVLIPARVLLNGASIAQEHHDRITWHHVELEWHDAVLAEGLPCETYLDTGNRAAFDNGGPVRELHADFAMRTEAALRIWAEQGMAPLVTDGPVVAALRGELIDRAAALGFATSADAAPVLHADGRILVPVRDGAGLRFDLPCGARSITLVSRSFAPADFDPISEDRRQLGLAVTWLEIDGVDVPAGNAVRAEGWHTPEAGWQWTDGAARLACPGARTIRLGFEPIGMRHVAEGDIIERLEAKRLFISPHVFNNEADIDLGLEILVRGNK